MGKEIEVFPLCRSIVDIVTTIEEVKEDLFTVSDEFRTEVKGLQRKLEDHAEVIRIQKLPTDSPIVINLQSAQLKLRGAALRLQNLRKRTESCCSCGWWCYAKLSMTWFPDNLEKTVKKVTAEMDKIPAVLKKEQRADPLVQCKSILDVLTKIEDVNGHWITLSDGFRDEMSIFRSRLFFSKSISTLELTVENSRAAITLKQAKETLRRAEMRLTNVQEKLERSACCYWGYYLQAKVNMLLFSEKLEKTVREVAEQMEKIEAIRNNEKDADAIFQHWDTSKPWREEWDNERFYVPIEESQKKVIEAVKNFSGPSIVLLHGGFGKGKSTLARSVIEGNKTRKDFDQVIFVSCSTESKALTAQLEILYRLSLGKEASVTAARIGIAVQKFWGNEKILIVLDNVSDERFLDEMWTFAKDAQNVKFLVTSQQSNLCRSLPIYLYLPVAMGDPSAAEAREILASHGGMRRLPEPRNLMMPAKMPEKVIQAVEGNPLALTSFAKSFQEDEIQEKRAWQDAYEGLGKKLSREFMFEQTEGLRSSWSAMDLCIRSFKASGAKKILLLMYACKQVSVPENVLSILFAAKKTLRSSFSKSMEELTSRELLKPTPSILSPNRGKSRSWSLGRLVRLYMETHMETYMAEDLASHTSTLLEQCEIVSNSKVDSEIMVSEKEIMESEKATVVVSLCALYFDADHRDQVVKHLTTEARKISNLDADDKINDLRLIAMEPIIRLLDQGEEDHDQCTEANARIARQVFIKYVCGQHKDDNVAPLLNLGSYVEILADFRDYDSHLLY